MVASVLPPLTRRARAHRPGPAPLQAGPSCRRCGAPAVSHQRGGQVPSRPLVRRDALIPAALAALLTLAATVVAPESPQDQEAICQRHNGVEACRVW